ncbi:antitoxin VapB family protein [Coraliomargarita parva]|uniref:antitoxin VapB family protein n=1 Tax=Coraliomargarita parva TaxID=3014050 RepID=UPI0022B2EE53|nr:hypothetical protein [Coraliomargarita parva]
MASKTISVSVSAYNRLKAHRRGSGDSFSRVILRARWDEETITAGELLEQSQTPRYFTEEELERIERAVAEDRIPEDKWSNR